MSPQDDPTRYHLPDPRLQSIVTNLNQVQGNRISITLYVGGVVISGTAVGISEWFEEQALLLEGDPVDDDASRTLTTEFREAWAGSLLNALIEPDETDPATRIHLLGASVHAGGTRLASGVMWRGGLLAVDGWNLGELVLPEAD